MTTKLNKLISERARALGVSQIRVIAEEAMKQDNVIPLYFGESAWPTAQPAVSAAIDALRHGDHFYQPNNGHPDLRQAISLYHSDLHHKAIIENRITVTSSGMQALAIVAQALVDPGDRVICVQPGWPNIAGTFEIAGGVISYENLMVENGTWKLDTTVLLDAIQDDTRAVVINSPSNPTGWVMPASDIQTIIEKCRKTGTWLVFDEVYSRLYRHGHATPSPLDFALEDDRVISVNSFSKAWSMTGWRLGWIIAPPALFSTLGKLTEFNIACAPGFIQTAGKYMLKKGEPVIADLKSRLTKGYEQVESGLSSNQRIGFVEPAGAFYAFFSVEGVEDSLSFAQQLLRETGVGLAPGSAFGGRGDGMFRLCYAQPVELVKEAVNRINTFVNR